MIEAHVAGPRVSSGVPLPDHKLHARDARHAGQDVVFKTVQQIGVELAVDALEISVRIDHLVLFSGDGDLRALVEAVQRRGVRVTVVSTIKTRPPMVADELRRQADTFLKLDNFRASIGQTME